MKGCEDVNYTAKNKNSLEFQTGKELLHQLLTDRGVVDPERFLNLDERVIHPASSFKDIEQATLLLGKHLSNQSRIGILIDCDLDGYGSAAIMYQFIKQVAGITCDYLTHNQKKHGLYPEVVDEILTMNLNLLILDHHLIECENPYATIVSSADGAYPNPTLVGGAVVYRFCQYVRDYYQLAIDLKPYLPLVALTLISDMADLRNYESRFFVEQGLKWFHLNPLLHEFAVQKKLYEADQSVTISNVTWTYSPLMNATIRTGEMEDKYRLFRALIGEEEWIDYTPRKSKTNPNPVPTQLSLQAYVLKRCETIKRQQDAKTKKAMAKIEEQIDNLQLYNDKVLLVNVTDLLDHSQTGLVANRLASKYKRGCLLLRKQEHEAFYQGSGRGYHQAEGIEDFRQFLLDSNQFENISGHSAAFGFKLPASNVEAVRAYANEQLQNQTNEDFYEVDYELSRSQLNKSLIEKVGTYQHIWSSTVPEPLFAMTDIIVSNDQVQLLGQKRNVIRITSKHNHEEISFMKFFTNEARYRKILCQENETGFVASPPKRLKLTIIGKFKINDYNGKQPQVEIVDIVSEPYQTTSLF